MLPLLALEFVLSFSRLPDFFLLFLGFLPCLLLLLLGLLVLSHSLGTRDFVAFVTIFIDSLVIEDSSATFAVPMIKAVAGSALHTKFPFVKTAETVNISNATITGFAAVAAMPVKDAEIRGGVNALLALFTEIVSVVGAIARVV